MKSVAERLRALGPGALQGIRRGVEKESLRVRPDGTLAATPHPAGLGSALAHPHITTDFSESQLELITGVHAGVDACREELTQIHQVIYRHIGDEVLWCASMPCGLPADDGIPLGQYGSSNVGRAKTVYRRGLSYRYGRRMQTISGIHYNFSLPEMSNDAYFALIRNFRRHSWLLLYLFGASPAVCASFVEGREHDLETLAPGTLGRPWATSLRMGRLGYQSDAQAALAVSYNSLESYAASLQDALTRPWPPYEAIGVRGPDGEYRQLATSLLQIENEFYGTIRPKRIVRRGERPLHALRERGLRLDRYGEMVELREWGAQLLAECAPIARALDEAHGAVHEKSAHRDALAAAVSALDNPDSLPSARMLREMSERYDNSYSRFALAKSIEHRRALVSEPLPAEAEALFARLAEKSVRVQREIEAADKIPFETFRQRYLSHESLRT